MDTTQKLELFGKEFITKVMDFSLNEYQMIKTGKMRSQQAKEISSIISSFNPVDEEKIDSIVLDVIGRLMHNTLRMFEESKGFSIADKKVIPGGEDILEISDGLSGELYGENGWVEKYSKSNYKSRFC